MHLMEDYRIEVNKGSVLGTLKMILVSPVDRWSGFLKAFFDISIIGLTMHFYKLL